MHKRMLDVEILGIVKYCCHHVLGLRCFGCNILIVYRRRRHVFRGGRHFDEKVFSRGARDNSTRKVKKQEDGEEKKGEEKKREGR